MSRTAFGRALRPAVLLFALLAAGCATMGPATIPRDRFDYAAAISDSWKNQMLLASNANTLSLGATRKYTDRPTITYSPLIGEKFSKSLMTPIPPAALLWLVQAGWNTEMLLRCCVHSINGHRNYSQRGAIGHAPDPEFVRLIQVLGRIQKAGGLGMRVVREKEASGTVLFFPPKVAGPSAADIAENRASPGFADVGAAASGLKPLIRVRSGVERPGDAFVTIRYRDLWFWIEDRDLLSKGMFSFLMFLFTLTESGGGQVSPVLTVPAG